MNKILNFIKNCFSRFKAFLKAKFTMLKKWFKCNQDKIPKIVYKIVTFIIILFITFSIGTCVGSSSKDIETAYADEVYYDGDYMTIDIGNFHYFSMNDEGSDYTVLPSIRTLYLSFNSISNNSLDFYYPSYDDNTNFNVYYNYASISVPFSSMVSDGTTDTYRYVYSFSTDIDKRIVCHYDVNEANNNYLSFEQVRLYKFNLELYNNSNLSSLLKTSYITTYLFIGGDNSLVNYYRFYDSNNILLGSIYIDSYIYVVGESDFVYGSNLATYYSVPIFNFNGIYDSAYQDGYDNGYDIGYNEGLNVGDDTSYQQGYDDGFRDGHIEGEQAGYDEGYGQGYFDGSEGPLKIFETIRIGFTRLLKIEIFPNFTIGSIFLLMLSISLLFFVVRVFIK